MGESEQGLATGTHSAPAHPALTTPGPQASSQEPQGGAGHVDPGRVKKHTKPLVEKVLLVENSSTRGFDCL